jgi:hypothetical protein
VIKVFHDKQKLKQYMTTKPPLQKILQGTLHTKVKANKTMKGQAKPNHRRRKGKKVESNIDSATHNQTLKQQRQLHDRDHHVPINNTLNINGLNTPSKDTDWQTGLKRKIQQSAAYRRPTSLTEISTG